MSQLVIDENKKGVQAFRMPRSTNTFNVATLAAASATSSVLVAGVYRVLSTVNVTIAMGAAATANDMPLRANAVEYFYVNAGETVSVWDAGVGGGILSLTLMP